MQFYNLHSFPLRVYQVLESLCILNKNYFEKNQGLDDVGGVEYLVKLTRFSGSANDRPY